jgi:hypothetical protein
MDTTCMSLPSEPFQAFRSDKRAHTEDIKTDKETVLCSHKPSFPEEEYRLITELYTEKNIPNMNAQHRHM